MNPLLSTWKPCRLALAKYIGESVSTDLHELRLGFIPPEPCAGRCTRIGRNMDEKEYSLKTFYKITYSLYAVLGAAFVFLSLKGLLFGSSDWLLNIKEKSVQSA